MRAGGPKENGNERYQEEEEHSDCCDGDNFELKRERLHQLCDYQTYRDGEVLRDDYFEGVVLLGVEIDYIIALDYHCKVD